MPNWLKKLLGISPAVAPPVPAAGESSRSPIIGISGASGSSKSVAAMISNIRAQGAIPVFLNNYALQDEKDAERMVAEKLKHLDGIIVLGNDQDIDPAKYGQPKHEKTVIETGHARAWFEEALIAQALAKNIPLLGVCGGMQRINVLGGGTLHQHVPDLVGDNHHAQGDKDQGEIAPFIPVQFVATLPGSRLSAMAKGQYTPSHTALPDGVAMENSFHHQAVAEVRPDFKIAAVAEDGIVEAIESKNPSQYVIGVQWHPEFGASDLSAKLTKDFVTHARDYARTHPIEEKDALAALAPTPTASEPNLPTENKWRDYLARRELATHTPSATLANTGAAL